MVLSTKGIVFVWVTLEAVRIKVQVISYILYFPVSWVLGVGFWGGVGFWVFYLIF